MDIDSSIAVDLGRVKQPDLGILMLNGFNYRLGYISDAEGNHTGIILQVWFEPLPWFKIGLPFHTHIAALDFLLTLQEQMENFNAKSEDKSD